MNNRATEFIRAGRMLLKMRALQQQADALEKQVKAILRTNGFLCYGLYGGSLKHVSLEVPLQDYLANFPDEKPRLSTWTNSQTGKLMGRLVYDDRWLPDTKDGYHIAIGSGSDRFDVPDQLQAQPPTPVIAS